MKTTSKILLAVIALFIISSSSVFAKNKKGHGSSSSGRFSIGAELGLPMGDFSDGYNIGFGGSLRYEMPLPGSDNIALTGTAGYLTYSGKTPDDAPSGYSAPTFGMIPIQVGAKYYFQEQQNGFYVMVELGVHSVSFKEQVPSFDFLTGTVTYTSETFTATDFSFAPEAGYALSNWDFGVRYQIISTTGNSTSYLGLRVAYVLGGK